MTARYIGYGSDVWRLACVLLLGKEFSEEIGKLKLYSIQLMQVGWIERVDHLPTIFVVAFTDELYQGSFFLRNPMGPSTTQLLFVRLEFTVLVDQFLKRTNSRRKGNRNAEQES